MEEQGQDANDLALYGQDSNGTVWSICNMNMILHNITRFAIENGDTLEDLQILGGGKEKLIRELLLEDDCIEAISRTGSGPPSTSCEATWARQRTIISAGGCFTTDKGGSSADTRTTSA